MEKELITRGTQGRVAGKKTAGGIVDGKLEYRWCEWRPPPRPHTFVYRKGQTQTEKTKKKRKGSTPGGRGGQAGGTCEGEIVQRGLKKRERERGGPPVPATHFSTYLE